MVSKAHVNGLRMSGPLHHQYRHSPTDATDPAIRVGTLNEQLPAVKRGRSGGDRISPSSTVVT